MKVFWWQGGLHVQPESDVESEALLVLLNAVRYERPVEIEDPRTPRQSAADAGGETARGSDCDFG